MDELLRHRPLLTWSLEKLAGRRWTTAELVSLVETGALESSLRFELVNGEVVPMPAAGRRHEIVCEALSDLMTRRRSDEVRVAIERQFNLDDMTFTNPDIVVRPAQIWMFDVRGPTALLVIEVADSSLLYDLGAKALLYAAAGVRDYWVINAWTLETKVHREPAPAGYANIRDVPQSEQLVPMLVPALAVQLSELALE